MYTVSDTPSPGLLSADQAMPPKKKGNRGGARGPKFIANAEEIEQRDAREGEWKAARKARRKEAGADTSSGDDSSVSVSLGTRLRSF